MKDDDCLNPDKMKTWQIIVVSILLIGPALALSPILLGGWILAKYPNFARVLLGSVLVGSLAGIITCSCIGETEAANMISGISFGSVVTGIGVHMHGELEYFEDPDLKDVSEDDANQRKSAHWKYNTWSNIIAMLWVVIGCLMIAYAQNNSLMEVVKYAYFVFIGISGFYASLRFITRRQNDFYARHDAESKGESVGWMVNVVNFFDLCSSRMRQHPWARHPDKSKQNNTNITKTGRNSEWIPSCEHSVDHNIDENNQIIRDHSQVTEIEDLEVIFPDFKKGSEIGIEPTSTANDDSGSTIGRDDISDAENTIFKLDTADTNQDNADPINIFQEPAVLHLDSEAASETLPDASFDNEMANAFSMAQTRIPTFYSDEHDKNGDLDLAPINAELLVDLTAPEFGATRFLDFTSNPYSTTDDHSQSSVSSDSDRSWSKTDSNVYEAIISESRTSDFSSISSGESTREETWIADANVIDLIESFEPIEEATFSNCHYTNGTPFIDLVETVQGGKSRA